MNRWLAALLVSLFALGAIGCPSGSLIQEDYVKADRATFAAVSSNYIYYVLSDPRLDFEKKLRRVRTIKTWELRLQQAEKPVSIAPATSGN